MLNHINIMGRMTRDPELRTTQTGTHVTTFSIACDRDFENNGERITDFIDCTAWRQRADFICRNFRKGDPILISGRLGIRIWQDRNDNTRRTPEIAVDDVYFCGGKRREQTNKNDEEYGIGTPGFEELDNDDELPFDIGNDELPL